METTKNEVMFMDNKFVNSVKNFEYANLQESQQMKLREVEKQFNTEFKTDYYFMVLQKD